jgi:hypothetical protein
LRCSYEQKAYGQTQQPPTWPEWLHEMKWDGWRRQIILSRRRSEWTLHLPSLVEAVRDFLTESAGSGGAGGSGAAGSTSGGGGTESNSKGMTTGKDASSRPTQSDCTAGYKSGGRWSESDFRAACK